VERGSDGGLGIEVDERNTVATAAQQPALRTGDVIVAVDGERLGGRPIAQVLQRADSYVFLVERAEDGAASIEALLLRLASRAAEVELDEEATADLRRSVEVAARSLLDEVRDAEPPPREALLGFWRRRFCSDEALMEKGVTGYGGLADCRVAASWQLLTDREPSLQTVEVIADGGTGKHVVAAKKGDWTYGEGGALSEEYFRLEYANSLQSAEPTLAEAVISYAGESVRLDVMADRSLVVYEREPAEVATGELQRLVATPVARAGDMPAWELADLARRGGSSPEAGGAAMM